MARRGRLTPALMGRVSLFRPSHTAPSPAPAQPCLEKQVPPFFPVLSRSQSPGLWGGCVLEWLCSGAGLLSYICKITLFYLFTFSKCISTGILN